MFIFQSIYAEFVTYVGSKKVKFKNGAFRTSDAETANHLRTKCKGIVIEVKSAAPVAEPPAAESKKPEGKKAEK
jgi:hypothetical protein